MIRPQSESALRSASLRAEALEHFVPGVGREADHELVDGLAREAALLRVLARARVVRQHAREVLRDAQVHVVERRGAARGVGLAAGLARHVEPESSRQLLDRLGERQLVVFHEEAERRAVRAAAEAVIELLDRAHPERRRLLVVERAAGAVFAAGFLELDARADELDDVRACGQVVDEALGNAAGHGGRDFTPGLSSPVQVSATRPTTSRIAVDSE